MGMAVVMRVTVAMAATMGVAVGAVRVPLLVPVVILRHGKSRPLPSDRATSLPQERNVWKSSARAAAIPCGAGRKRRGRDCRPMPGRVPLARGREEEKRLPALSVKVPP